MRCSTSLKDPVQASVTCLGGATSGAIPDLVRPRPAFGCDAVSCRTGRVRRHWGCHLYFARRVSFLSCADRTRSPIQLPTSPSLGGKIVYGAGDFAHFDDRVHPPAMPDWSPVRRFGGYAASGDLEGAA